MIIYDRQLGSIQGIARNVGPGGLFVETSLALPASTPVRVEVECDRPIPRNEPLLSAVVAYCANGGAGLMPASRR